MTCSADAPSCLDRRRALPATVVEQKQYYFSTDLAPRLAAIDIGTNSIRLIIAEGLRDGKYRVLDDEKDATRLGKNLEATKRLDPEAVERSLGALRRMRQITEGYQVSQLRAIATCAVREATDGAEFCQRVKREVGLDIEVVSAKKEAHLAFFSAVRNFDLEGKNVAVVDIGGGSTEIVLGSGTIVEAVYTASLGAVRLSELYGSGQTMTGEQFNRLLKGTDRLLRKHLKKPLFVPHLLIGSGGTFTTLATMLMASKRQEGLPVRGYPVARADVRHLVDRLRKMSPKARRSVPGLSPDRADIIVAGLAIIDSVMRRLEVNFLQVHDGGVRDGLLLTMVYNAAGLSPDQSLDRTTAIEQFAARCGVDLQHGRHVAMLAGSLLTELSARFPSLSAEDRPLLEAAAQLQDVGYLINYEQHHKHSYHLILNSRISGFEPSDLELIANIARYHRGAKPKRKHANFRQLSPRNQQRVRQLAAILRLAGGFDRSHSQQVKAVNVSDHGDEIHMHAVAQQFPEVDLWGTRRRSAIFEKLFGVSLVIDWQPTVAAGPEAEAAPKPEVNLTPPARAPQRTSATHATRIDPRGKPAVAGTRPSPK